VEIPTDLVDESRRFARAEIESERLDIGSELGFAMLHLGDEGMPRNTFAMLFVCTWRHNNELWQTLFTKSLASNCPYELFVEDGHIGAFCVWELGVVLHERDAWNRFLYSSRDDAAAREYLAAKYEGPV
jgi:hypothetical protein